MYEALARLLMTPGQDLLQASFCSILSAACSLILKF